MPYRPMTVGLVLAAIVLVAAAAGPRALGAAPATRPDKRTCEMLGWYLLGLASEEDVVAFLNRPDRTGVKKAAEAALWAKLGFKPNR